MIIKNAYKVEKEIITDTGVKGTVKQNLLSNVDNTPTFSMRRFTITPGGFTFHHTHDFEHEIYVLSGKGYIKVKDGDRRITQGTAGLIMPNEVHQFVNDGDEPLVFLCIIPNSMPGRSC